MRYPPLYNVAQIVHILKTLRVRIRDPRIESQLAYCSAMGVVEVLTNRCVISSRNSENKSHIKKNGALNIMYK